MAEEMLDLEAVRGELGIGRNTVYGLARSGRLGAVKIGGGWRLSRSVLDRIKREGLPRAAQKEGAAA